MKPPVVQTDALRSAYRSTRRHVAGLAVTGRQMVTRGQLSPIRFIVFARARSGSTALVGLLDGLPTVQCDGEVLHDPVPFPRTFVRARCALSGSPAYGCKILSYQIATVQRLRQRTEFVRRLSEDGFRIIYLRRENLVEHAVSQIRAREFGFHRLASARGDNGKIPIDPQSVLNWIARSERMLRFEEKSLVGVPHLALTYERNLVSDKLHHSTVLQIAEFLRLPTENISPPKSAYQKVSPRLLSDSVANYSELVAALSDTPYARDLS